ncbi:lipoprotein [Roseococcus sp. YIM B11640]|uniref:lipoprotein n=1 Tax=Roseococcus sp. YIM B11640 TaxID=3133973 RepID=UPI003C7DAF56
MRSALILLAAVSLAGCGRVGPPRPPGPQEAITYPRSYPAPTAEDREVARTRALGIPPGVAPR